MASSGSNPSEPAPPAHKRKRVMLTIKQKLEVIEKREEGVTVAQLSALYNVGEQTIRDVMKNKFEIIRFASTFDNAAGLEKRKSMKKSTYEDLDEVLYTWIQLKHSCDEYPDYQEIQQKAMQISRDMLDGETNFAASQGWWYRFRKRHGLRFDGSEVRRRVSLDGEPSLRFSPRVQDIAKKYHLSDLTGDQRVLCRPPYYQPSPEVKYEDASKDSLPAPEDHGSSEFGHNNGDEVPVAVSPEQFLAETSERELTPAPPTPTPQKPESYQLRHNNHLTIVLEALARDESFMDVTLTAQGRSLKAHKSVLSAVSPYFRGVLRDNPCQHPIIIMPRDVRFEELFSIVNYIYKGEMTVAAEDLTSLLKTAEILQVSGLAPSDSSATVNPHTDSSTAGNARSSSASSSSSSSNLPSVSRTPRVSKVSAQQSTTPPPRPRSRDSTINPTDFMDVDMTCVKEEVPSGGEEETEEQISKESSAQPPGSGIKDQTLQQSLPAFSPSYDPSLEQPSGSTCASQNVGSTTMAIKSDPEAEVNSQMTVSTENPQPFICPHCQEQHRDMDTMITHLRVKHPTKPSFTCGCGRIFTRQINHQAHARICSSSS